VFNSILFNLLLSVRARETFLITTMIENMKKSMVLVTQWCTVNWINREMMLLM